MKLRNLLDRSEICRLTFSIIRSCLKSCNKKLPVITFFRKVCTISILYTYKSIFFTSKLGNSDKCYEVMHRNKKKKITYADTEFISLTQRKFSPLPIQNSFQPTDFIADTGIPIPMSIFEVQLKQKKAVNMSP